MGLEPDLPGMVEGESRTPTDTDIALKNAKALAEGLRGSGVAQDEAKEQSTSSPPGVPSRMWGFSTKPSGRFRQESFRTQMKIEEDAATGLFGVDRQSSLDLRMKGNRFSRRPSTSTGADQISGMLPAEYANDATLSNITEQSLQTGRSSDGADTSLRGTNISTLGALPFSPVQEEREVKIDEKR